MYINVKQCATLGYKSDKTTKTGKNMITNNKSTFRLDNT